MDRLTAAQVFVDIAQSGSFTATAERLDMSRPMVTRYVEAMEKWLNARLLHRTTRQVALTTVGEECLTAVEVWLEQAQSIAALVDIGEELTGSVRLAASTSFGFSQLVPAVNSFMMEHTKVKIDIDLHDSVADLTERQIDLAIRIASNPDPSLIGKPISVCESVIVASPDYIASHDKVTAPYDLANHQCLGYKNFQRHVWHLTKNGQQTSVDVDCRLTANEATALLHAAIDGAGVAIQPSYLANRYIKSGVLQELLPEWKPAKLSIFALYSSRKHLSPTVRALIDHLEEYFVRNPW